MAITFALLSRFKIVPKTILEYLRIDIGSAPMRTMEPNAIACLNTDSDFISKSSLCVLVRAPRRLIGILVYNFPNLEVDTIDRHETGLAWISPDESILQINLRRFRNR
jgi:hypothetical protein